MKSSFIFLLCLAATAKISAQNIVSNGSFETHTSCPDNYGEVTYCSGWTNIGSSDYFNSCASIFFASVPDNGSGHIAAFDGNAYMGFYAYNHLLTGTDNMVEYITAHVPPMTVGTTYDVSIEVALAGKTSNVATSGLGVFFSTYSRPETVVMDALPVTPQVDYSPYGIISDTLHWTRLSEHLIADSAYNTITIGCYRNMTHTDTMTTNFGLWSSERVAYYFIDSVVIMPATGDVTSTTGISTGHHATATVVWPNPCRERATIVFSEPLRHGHTMRLYNSMGQTVATENAVTGREALIERGNLPAGMYYYMLADDDGNMIRGKVEFVD